MISPAFRSRSRHVWAAASARRNLSTTAPLRRINKIIPSATEAIQGVKSSSTVLVGGFGFSGVPSTLINAVAARPDIQDLTVVSNNAGMPGVGLGQLLETRQISKMVASYIGENKTFEKMYLTGELSLELLPQGTMVERCAAGAAGVPAFYTPAGYGTLVQTGQLPVKYNPDGTVAVMSKVRETRDFGGKNYVLEESIFGDVALVKVNKADRLGNCTFRKAQNNFNEAMAKNAKFTIVEADEIVDAPLEPESIHIQGIYVDAVIKSTAPKEIEKLVTRSSSGGDSSPATPSSIRRDRIIRRVAKELKDGMYVNLGIGIPLAAPALVPEGVEVILQSENGMLGMGRYPEPGEEDPDLINPGKETVTLNPGASTFGSHESFGMIRAGKINMTVLGAFQVSQYGDLANFMLPGKVKGIGGAMDLVANPEKTRVVVTMVDPLHDTKYPLCKIPSNTASQEHVDKKGRAKIVQECTFPLTGQRCVSRIITDIAVFDCTPQGLVLRELFDEVTMDELKAVTGAPFEVARDLKAYDI